jgi:hypothetical protein
VRLVRLEGKDLVDGLLELRILKLRHTSRSYRHIGTRTLARHVRCSCFPPPRISRYSKCKLSEHEDTELPLHCSPSRREGQKDRLKTGRQLVEIDSLVGASLYLVITANIVLTNLATTLKIGCNA